MIQIKYPKEYDHWIIKFPSSSDPIDIAQIEYAYHKMAIDAGIEMSEWESFSKGISGKKYFGTKRFDRKSGNKLHMHSASGLMHDNFRLSNMDYAFDGCSISFGMSYCCV
ncbi:MAG: HipA domain-containing protein [Bacteroidia bacterium]